MARDPRAVIAALVGVIAGCSSATVRRASPEPRAFPANAVRLAWRAVIHQHGLFEPRPEECATGVVVGPRLITGSRAGKIGALDLRDGRLLWSTPGSGSIDGEARFDEGHGQVYVGTDDGTFYALDPALGTVRWSYKGRGAIERRPELSADSVYVTSSADRVVAFEARTGTVRWQYERESPEGFTIHGHAGARLVEGVVYAGFSDGYLVALDGATGDPIWTRSLAGASDQFVDVDTTPTVVENMLVASSYSGGLWALRAKDSEVQWRLGIEGVSAIGIGGGRIYVAAPRDGLAALTRQGHVLWRQGLADAGDLTPPVAVGPYLVFAASRDGLFVIDRESGKLLQIFNPGRGMCAAPAIDSKARRMYALANSGSLYALDVDY